MPKLPSIACSAVERPLFALADPYLAKILTVGAGPEELLVLLVEVLMVEVVLEVLDVGSEEVVREDVLEVVLEVEVLEGVVDVEGVKVVEVVKVVDAVVERVLNGDVELSEEVVVDELVGDVLLEDDDEGEEDVEEDEDEESLEVGSDVSFAIFVEPVLVVLKEVTKPAKVAEEIGTDVAVGTVEVGLVGAVPFEGKPDEDVELMLEIVVVVVVLIIAVLPVPPLVPVEAVPLARPILDAIEFVDVAVIADVALLVAMVVFASVLVDGKDEAVVAVELLVSAGFGKDVVKSMVSLSALVELRAVEVAFGVEVMEVVVVPVELPASVVLKTANRAVEVELT